MLFKIDTPNVIEEENFKTEEVEREIVSYTDCSQRFYEVSRDYSKQYAHIYAARLCTFRKILSEKAAKKWSNKYKILKLCELREKNTTCIVIGTLFKHQELKPSILRELSDDLEIIPPPVRTHFVHESDTLVLEDELQRIKLAGDCIDVNSVVTGMVCAVLGSEDGDGLFTVQDICWPGCSIQKPFPKIEGDRFVVLMSGLNMSSKEAEHWFHLQLMLEWLSGAAGSSSHRHELAKVVRVVIAGGVFSSRQSSGLTESEVVSSAAAVDAWCAALAAAAAVDVLAGARDPQGLMMPQKPFHYCLFPKAVEYKSFKRVSNPYECDIGGYRFLGTSGQPVRDIMRHTTLDSPLSALKLTIQCRHVAPSCPDTAPAAPAVNTDPFIMDECPAVYYTGDCDTFDTQLYEGEGGQKVRLVCVPDFYTTKTIALVNLATLDCYSMSFA